VLPIKIAGLCASLAMNCTAGEPGLGPRGGARGGVRAGVGGPCTRRAGKNKKLVNLIFLRTGLMI